MSAYRDKSGTWRFRKWVQLPSGERKRISGTPDINTKTAAESAEHAEIQTLLHPELVKSGAVSLLVPTFETFSVQFERDYLPFGKPSEKQAKKYAFKGALNPFFGPLLISDIDQGHIDGFVAAQKLKGMSVKTIRNRLTMVSTMLRYAATLGLTAEPKIKCHISGMSAEILAVPACDVAKLVTAADTRMRVAVLLAAEAGLRVGEIRGLQHGDIKDGQLTIRRAIDPSGNIGSPKHDKRRSVPCSPALTQALAQLAKHGLWVMADPDGSLPSYSVFLDKLHALYDAAEVTVPVSETGHTSPWHSLRHTFGTELAARGVPITVIMALMGHSDMKTCQRYITTVGAQLTDAIALAFGQKLGNGNQADAATVEDSKAVVG